MSDSFREVGLGLADGAWDWGPPWGVLTSSALTQAFAKSGSAHFLLGVAFDDADGDGVYDPGEGLGGLSVSIQNMATRATTTLVTWSAGGWQTPLAPGSYEVTFSGGGLAAPVTRGVTLGAANAKLDLELDAAPAAAQTLYGTNGAETLTAGDGHDVINARAGHDWLFGGVGNDTLHGLAGADTILGGSGRDRLHGGDGDDVLIGGPGVDALHGGSGADRFVFLSTLDRGDRILDFNPAEGDRVVIDRAIAANAGTTWAQLSASGHARLTQGATGALLSIDVNGGGDRWTPLVTFDGLTVAQLGTDFLIG
jgi:Ca2+-binding RTX toxin-like protein